MNHSVPRNPLAIDAPTLAPPPMRTAAFTTSAVRTSRSSNKTTDAPSASALVSGVFRNSQ